MDGTLIQLPVADPEAPARTLAELVAAIDLVARGVARRVVVVGEADVDAVAAQALAHAQLAGVRFSLVRDHPGSPLVVVGPRQP